MVTGGDDGRLSGTRISGAEEIADLKGKWIDAVDASAETGLIAFASGRDLHVRIRKTPDFTRLFRP